MDTHTRVLGNGGGFRQRSSALLNVTGTHVLPTTSSPRTHPLSMKIVIRLATILCNHCIEREEISGKSDHSQAGPDGVPL